MEGFALVRIAKEGTNKMAPSALGQTHTSEMKGNRRSATGVLQKLRRPAAEQSSVTPAGGGVGTLEGKRLSATQDDMPSRPPPKKTLHSTIALVLYHCVCILSSVQC